MDDDDDQPTFNFDGDAGGETFDRPRDRERLARQRNDVWRLMRDGEWRTLHQIAMATGHPEASISARLRDFRKPRFGEHTVEREYLHAGLWRYRLLVNRPAETTA